MIVIEKKTTLIPNTITGKKFADECEEHLKKCKCFRERKEDINYIIIKSEYNLIVEEGE